MANASSLPLLLLLVGPKGVGKTFIGSVLEAYLGVTFLRIEPIFLDLMQRSPELQGIDLEKRGFQIVLDTLDALATEHSILCFESTGTARTLTEVLAALHDRFQVKFIRVQAPVETCVERVLARDASVHIPVSEARLREINAYAAQVDLPWDLEIDNADFLEETTIVERVRSLLP